MKDTVSNEFVSNKEYKCHLQKIVEMIRNGSPREDIINYIERLINIHSEGGDRPFESAKQNQQLIYYDKVTALKCIKNALDDCGFYSEIRQDRKGGPYVNMGDVKSLKLRAQFWFKESTQEVQFWAGKEMGYWYTLSIQSKYRVPWDTLSDKENKLVFPDMVSVIEYIKSVAKSAGYI